MAKKCNRKTLTFCGAAEAYSDENGQYGKGRRIYIANTMNLNTRKESIRLVYNYGGKYSEYVYLPFCPFCGVKLT